MTPPKISIILATHNTPVKRLQRVLKAVKANTNVPYELMIVDTSESRGQVSTVSSIAARFHSKFLKPIIDRGLGASWNLGAAHAAAPVLGFLCDDVYVDADWASEGMRYLKGNVKVLSGKLYSSERNGVLNAAGSFTDVFGVSWNRAIDERDDGRYDEPEPIFRAVGAIFMIDRNAFWSVGGFDESYFLYAEDLDISWRLRLAGYDCMYVPTMQAHHEWMATTSKHTNPLLKYHYLLERNRIQTILKNYSTRTLLSILPWYIIIKAAHVIWLVLNGQLDEVRRLFKAFFWIGINRREILRKRYLTQRLRKRNDRQIQRLMLKLPAELLLGLGFFKHPLVAAARRRK